MAIATEDGRPFRLVRVAVLAAVRFGVFWLGVVLLSPAQFGDKPTKEFPRVYGILMDWPTGEQTATVFSSSTGAASLYTTSTFGIIGGEEHETVRTAAIHFVRAADRLFEAATPTTEFPYPAANRVRFYFLTFDGVRVLDTDLASIESGTSKYAGLFDLGQTVRRRVESARGGKVW